MQDILFDALIDTLKVIPFLIIAFSIIELLEHKIDSEKIIKNTNKAGPVIGSLLGAIPQCGFSTLATNLYISRIITLGTLISVYLSTSDEMIPILLSENISINNILSIVIIKVLIGITLGIIIDLFYKNTKKKNYSICETDHCNCNESIVKSIFIHSSKICLFILIINILLNTIFYYGLEEILNNILLNNSIFTPFITSLIGLIPNCAASVLITKLYISSSINFAALLSGLLTNSGLGILLLFKSNKNIKENLIIISILYITGIIVGIITNFILIMI